MASEDWNEANLQPTVILDHGHERVRAFCERIDVTGRSLRGWLQAAHARIAAHVAPVYTLAEHQPVSRTLARGVGSCSQRFACLEALARSRSIPTRVRGLWIRGRFWAPRFPWARWFIPRRILLAWPQFLVDGDWLGVEELFGALRARATAEARGFANDGESLFEAVGHTAVDFAGRTAGCAGGACDLSRFVAGEAGTYATRDELFAAHPVLLETLRGRLFERIWGGRPSR